MALVLSSSSENCCVDEKSSLLKAPLPAFRVLLNYLQIPEWHVRITKCQAGLPRH
jgi:hypothetical protein